MFRGGWGCEDSRNIVLRETHFYYRCSGITYYGVIDYLRYNEKTMHTLEEIHQYQLDISLPRIVALNACGVASMIQVLKYFNKFETTSEEIFHQFVNAGRYSKKIVNLNFDKLPGVKIPYTFLSKDQEEESAIQEVKNWKKENNVTDNFLLGIDPPNSAEYLPTFSLKCGSDSRGIKDFLEHADLNVTLYEYLRDGKAKESTKSCISTDTEENFTRLLEKELNLDKLIIASVKKSEIPYLEKLAIDIYGKDSPQIIGTHLIVLKQKGNAIYAVDPIIEAPNKAVRELNKDNLFNALVRGRERGRFLTIQN